MIPTIQHKKIKRTERFAVTFLMLFTGLALSACDTTDTDEDETTAEYTGSFIPVDELVETTASGNITATHDPVTNQLSYTIVWNDLSSPVVDMFLNVNGSAVHSDRPWDPDESLTSGEVIGEVILEESEVEGLVNGNLSVLVTTENYPEGEIEAFLVE